ncbi:MAG: DUF1499 domain-containing protein [Nitrospirota bacterium]|nr:DUF1499 domain-containing protein [Nitrospirota bacterium]
MLVSTRQPNDTTAASRKMIPPCPDSPNCVSSAPGTDTEHIVEPLHYPGTLDEAKTHLLAIIHAMPRTQIVQNDSHYLHVECTSLLLRFVDDVEFWFDAETPLVHVRSASRVGYSDLGANRKRVESIRSQWKNRVETPNQS